jgi:MoxR-like ATPase
MIEAAFAASDQEGVILITGDENTSFDDLYGTWVGNGDGNWEWSDGPATQALKQGKVLFIDDITLISPLVLASLYSVLDGRDEVIIKTHMTPLDADGNPWPDSMKHQEVVRAADGFFLVGAYNPSTPGALLAPALASRFKLHLEVTSDYDLAQNAGVPVELVKIARTLDTARTEHRIGWAPQMRELFDAAKIAKKFGMEIALSNLAGIPDDEDDRIFILDKIRQTMGSSSQRLSHLQLGKQI